MPTCSACKSSIQPQDRFCSRCGAQQEARKRAPGVGAVWTLEQKGARWVLATGNGRMLLVAAAGDGRDRLNGYSLEAGDLNWTYDAHDSEVEPVRADRSGFLVLNKDRLLRLSAENGDEVWESHLPGTSVPLVRPRPADPLSVVLVRGGPGSRELRGWTLDLLNGRLREIVDHVALETFVSRSLGAYPSREAAAEVALARIGGDGWTNTAGAFFAAEGFEPDGSGRNAGLVVHVDALTRELVVRTRQASGIPLGRGLVYYADTDESEMLVWAKNGGLVVLPLDVNLDPIRFEVPGLIRLVEVSKRRAYVEVYSGGSRRPGLLVLSLPFGKPVWQSPADAPCSFMGLDRATDSLFLRLLDVASVREYRTRDHSFCRSYSLPESFAPERLGREKVDPGPVRLVSAGRLLVLQQQRDRVTALAAFERGKSK